jgi:hypothetical protein
MIVAAAAYLAGTLPNASGVPLPARFWISESKDNPGLPQAPTITAAIGRQRTLYIWAQPATDAGGVLFRDMENFSLDVVTLDTSLQPEPAPFIDFIDGTYKVENPTVIGVEKRFQYTADSSRAEAQGGPLTSEQVAQDILEFDLPDALKGLEGASPFVNPSTVGIGHSSDPYRRPSGSSFAWRVGEFAFQALESSGTNYLFLQIGHHGMGHEDDGDGEPPLATQVVFGNNATPIYSASNLGHRQTTLATDTFDLRVNAVPAVPGDFNGDGIVGPEDFNAWQTGYGQFAQPAGNGADGNANGIVDAADYVVWRKLAASSGGAMPGYELAVNAASVIVPEPGTISLAVMLLLLVLLDVGQRARH